MRLTLDPVRLSARKLAWIYCALALVFTIGLAFALPPMQGADEGAHYVRADQISLGGFIGHRLTPIASGGLVDLGIIAAVDRFYPLVIDPNARIGPLARQPMAWGRQGPWSFPNTAVYPPVFYMPAAAAIIAGKGLGLDVLATERLARIACALASVALATLAIALAGPAAAWLFTLLLLPSSAALMGVITQDGPLLAASALAASLWLRLIGPSRPWRAALTGLCILLALIGMSRPPYGALAFLPLITGAPPRRYRALGTASVLAAIALWSLVSTLHTFVSVDPTHQANAAAQLSFLLAHPGQVVRVAAQSMRVHFAVDYAGYFITTLQPPGVYSAVAWCALALALAASCARGFTADARRATFTAAMLAASAAGIVLIQYLTWTPVGAPVVNGVLGRYFLPLAAIAIVTVVRIDTDRPAVTGWLGVPLLAFPFVSMAVTMTHVMTRYHGAGGVP